MVEPHVTMCNVDAGVWCGAKLNRLDEDFDPFLFHITLQVERVGELHVSCLNVFAPVMCSGSWVNCEKRWWCCDVKRGRLKCHGVRLFRFEKEGPGFVQDVLHDGPPSQGGQAQLRSGRNFQKSTRNRERRPQSQVFQQQ